MVLAATAPCLGQVDESGNANASSDQGAPPKQDVVATVTLVEGQVVNHIGAGEPDVTITLRVKNADGSPGDVIAAATSDKLGDFQITGPKTAKGPAVVTFSKAGFATAARHVELGAHEYPPFVDLEMEGNLPLIGAVHDTRNDKPVSGASVMVKAVYREWTAETDEKGRFTVKGLPPGEAMVIVKAEGYGREQRAVDDVADFGEIVVPIKPERIVHIKTVDEAGEIIPRVTVECFDRPRQDFRTLMTDATGRVTIRSLHFDAEVLELRLFHEDYVSSMDFDRRIEISPDEVETSQDFVMKEAGRIVGRVIDARSREPLGGARVIVGTEYSDYLPHDHTDFEGGFKIKGVAPGKAVVTVHRSGYAPELHEIEVRAGREARLEVKLQPPRVVKGVVLDHDGDPASGAFVYATRWREYATLGLRAVTGDNGVFEIYDAPGDGFELSAMSADRATGECVVKPDDGEVKITLSEPPMGGRAGGGPGESAAFKVGDPAPDFAVTTINNVELSLANLKGKTILLDFWATWCGPCVVDLPNLLAIHEAYGGRDDFVMIGVSLDRNESDLRRFIDKHRMNWHQVFGDKGGANAAADAFGVVGIPAVFLIAPDGKIVATDLHGPGGKDRVADVLERNEAS